MVMIARALLSFAIDTPRYRRGLSASKPYRPNEPTLSPLTEHIEWHYSFG